MADDFVPHFRWEFWKLNGSFKVIGTALEEDKGFSALIRSPFARAMLISASSVLSGNVFDRNRAGY